MEKVKEKEKAKSKEKALRMRKLAVSNCKAQIGTFKALLSDPPTASDLHSHPIKSISAILLSSPSSITPVAAAHLTRQTDFQAKKSVLESLAQRLGCTTKVKASKKRGLLYLPHF